MELQRDGAVFVLHMRDGENRIDRAFVRDFGIALDEVEASEGDAALVTTGEGKFYSNGLDIAGLAGAGPEDAVALLNELNRLFARVLALPVVTVAAINGHAFAAGGMLAVAHDYRVMRADRGYWCLPEVDLRTGKPLTPGMHAVLTAKLPPAVVHEALITGRRYTAQEALTAGIVQAAEEEQQVLAKSIDLARGLAQKHRATLGAIKRGLYERELATLRAPLEASFL